MAESYVQLPPDGSGRKLRSFTATVGQNTVEHQAVVLCDSSGNVIATLPVSGPLTDAQLRATPVPVSGTFYPATQPVSGSVSVGNFPSTQAVSGSVSVSNLPATQAVSGTVSVGNFPGTQTVAGTVAVSNLQSAALAVTATGTAAAAVTLTLPAAGAGLFHYLCSLEITLFSTAARTGSATPVLVTTTNLPGTPAYTFGSAGAIGTTDRYMPALAAPVKSAVANTATTIVAPATTAALWRINATYYAAA